MADEEASVVEVEEVPDASEKRKSVDVEAFHDPLIVPHEEITDEVFSEGEIYFFNADSLSRDPEAKKIGTKTPDTDVADGIEPKTGVNVKPDIGSEDNRAFTSDCDLRLSSFISSFSFGHRVY